MKIQVTSEHILKRKFRPWDCPIALAAKDALGIKSISVGNLTINSIDRTLYMPEEAITFIRKFDCQLPVEPFTFDAIEN